MVPHCETIDSFVLPANLRNNLITKLKYAREPLFDNAVGTQNYFFDVFDEESLT
jgi:hypothetical protein